jgi:hypothetical protein
MITNIFLLIYNINYIMNYNNYDILALEHKIRKYSKKLEEAKNQMDGGAKDDSKNKPERKERKDRPESKHVLRVECVEVDQKNENVKYNSRTCKTPPMNIRLSEENNKLSYIAKIILNYVNKRLRTKEIKELHYTVNKKTTKVSGDKLGETMINVVSVPEIQDILIIM